MDRAMITVSYGVRDACEFTRSVAPVEAAVAGALPGYRRFSACAGREGVSILRQGGLDVRLFEECLEAVRADGIRDICVSPLLITRGEVCERILKAAGPLPVAKPLLDTPDDFERIGDMYGKIARDTGREVLLMGHGSRSGAETGYLRLARALPAHVHLACRTGLPRPEDVFRGLDPDRDRLLLMPLMLAAGRHAREELAGSGPSGWESVLRAGGFDVQARPEGMGTLAEIQEMFAEKARAAAGQL